MNEYKMPPLTETQAVNVARNALHTLVHAQSIGGNAVEMLAKSAQEPGSDIRVAIGFLDKIHETMRERDRLERLLES